MADLDLNLLVALEALLTEKSVTGAARRLGLSASAMSRTLGRLRTATGDPLLVRAGRQLVPTPRAAAMQDRVRTLGAEVRTLLEPPKETLNIAAMARTFTICANECFIELFAAAIVTMISEAAPLVGLRFAPQPVKTAERLRSGEVDLEIGVFDRFAPEMRMQSLFRDRFVGAVRRGHPLLAGQITPDRYAACRHIISSRSGDFDGPVDEALATLKLKRETRVIVPGFGDAMRIARQTDLVATVPKSLLREGASEDLVAFDLPIETSQIVVSALWHPRMQADLKHRFLREIVISTCRAG